MVLTVVTSGIFFLVMGVLRWVKNKNSSDSTSLAASSALPTVAIILLSKILKKMLDKFSQYEMFLTKNKYFISKAQRITVSKLFTTTISLGITIGTKIYINMKEKDSQISISEDPKKTTDFSLIITGTLFSYFKTASLLEPLLTIVSFSYSIAWIKKQLKVVKMRGKEPVMITQNELMGYFDRPDPEIEMKYSSMCFWIYLAACSTFIVPMGGILILMVVILLRLVHKFLLYTRYGPPVKNTDNLALRTAKFVRHVPKVYFLFRFLFYYVLPGVLDHNFDDNTEIGPI